MRLEGEKVFSPAQWFVEGSFFSKERDISTTKKRNNLALMPGTPAWTSGRNGRDHVRTAIGKRVQGARHKVDAEWRYLLDDYLFKTGDSGGRDLEENAREEKTAALQESAESRLSVLVGPAGTGKTTLLSVLYTHPQIATGDVLLLAPTGKARVRMEQSTGHLKLKGYTIAQFLSPHRYDGAAGR